MSKSPLTGAEPMAVSLAPGQVEKPSQAAQVGLLGASGYSGMEFLRLAKAHPGLRVASLGVRDAAQRSHAQLFPGWADHSANEPGMFELLEPETVLEQAQDGAIDTIVSALPHGVFRDLLAGIPAWGNGEGPRIVDLSGDHRTGATGFVYGLPELFREEVRQAHWIANPGCYATAAILALTPAARAGWLDGAITVSAISGVSGAGRAPSLNTSFVEVNDGASYYRAGGDHAHIPEIERVLSRVQNETVACAFTPQLVPMSRGILLTAVAALRAPKSNTDVRALYESQYGGEAFVRILPAGEWPATHAVRGSNRCDLAPMTQHDGSTLIVLAALDNLVKGAAGQAVQNLNLMLGWPETTGLPVEAWPW